MPVPLLDCRCNGLSSRRFPKVRQTVSLSDESLQCPGWTVIVPTQLTGKSARVRIMQIPATLRAAATNQSSGALLVDCIPSLEV